MLVATTEGTASQGTVPTLGLATRSRGLGGSITAKFYALAGDDALGGWGEGLGAARGEAATRLASSARVLCAHAIMGACLDTAKAGHEMIKLRCLWDRRHRRVG